MINDLRVPDVNTWKFVDDTTVAEVVPRGSLGNAQSAVTVVEDWSLGQRMQLNSDKCKEMVIDFKNNKHGFNPLTVDRNELDVVKKAKILGVTLSNNLKWNDHVIESIKKANKRLYFLVLLRRADVPLEDIVMFYRTTIRPVLEYCSPVFHHSLPAYLSDDLERVQKRALSVISPALSYQECLAKCGLTSLRVRREVQCRKLFSTISSPSHRLSRLLPPYHQARYNMRKQRTFDMPRIRTDRFKRSFIPAMCSRANSNY